MTRARRTGETDVRMMGAVDRNRNLLVGVEEVHPAAQVGTVPTFHCVLDPRLAPGYLAWVVDDGHHVHVGTAGYATCYPEGPWGALRRLTAAAPHLVPPAGPREVELRGGRSRWVSCCAASAPHATSWSVTRRAPVSPLTAGGLDPCLRLSDHAVTILDEALTLDDPAVLRAFDGAALRRRFRGRVAMRRLMSLVRTPALMATAFVVLRTPQGQEVARRIVFEDRAFPLPAPVQS